MGVLHPPRSLPRALLCSRLWLLQPGSVALQTRNPPIPVSPDSVRAQQYSARPTMTPRPSFCRRRLHPSAFRSFLPIFAPSPTSPSAHTLAQYSYFRRPFVAARACVCTIFSRGRDLHLLLLPCPYPPLPLGEYRSCLWLCVARLFLD